MAILKNLWPEFAYKPHQLTGVYWMLERENDPQVKGGILCDEMGLGKTIQVLGLIKNGVQKPREKNLLIAPVAVLQQWKKVIQKANMIVMVVSESGASWVQEGPKKNDLASRVYCIGYEAATRKFGLVTSENWERVICDEAHRMASKNQATYLAEKITSKKKWLLTGTPIVNKFKDLCVLLDIIGVKNLPGKTPESLSGQIKKYVLARTMEQLRKSIPDAPKAAIHKTIHLDFLTKEEETFYHAKADIIENRLKQLSGNGRSTTLERLKLIMRLRQVSLHPQIYNEARKRQLKSLWTQPDWLDTSTKFEAIKTLITESKESHKWILFCHFRDEMNMLDKLLRGESSIELVQQYHGSLSSAQKEDVIERSLLPVMEGKQEVLLVQIQSGGTGLNLQHFDHIIFTGPWWTSALIQQAVGRAVRIGQTKQVIVYHLHLKAEGEDDYMNIDHFISKKAAEKGELCSKVLENATRAVTLTDLSTY
jgi:SNF2 family DNA or RNA helicase